MVTKLSPDLPRFGRYLAYIRKRAGIRSQRQAAAISQRLDKEGIIDIASVTYSQINADEKGLVSDLPMARLKAYSIIYKVPFSEIVDCLVAEKYGVSRSEDSESPATEIPENATPDEREAYELLRHLLDTRNREGVLTCLRMIAGESGDSESCDSVSL